MPRGLQVSFAQFCDLPEVVIIYKNDLTIRKYEKIIKISQLSIIFDDLLALRNQDGTWRISNLLLYIHLKFGH